MSEYVGFPTGHRLTGIGRHQNGMSPTAPSRPMYGTHASCECGKRFKSNDAPSKGGERSVRNRHKAHVQEITDEGK